MSIEFKDWCLLLKMLLPPSGDFDLPRFRHFSLSLRMKWTKTDEQEKILHIYLLQGFQGESLLEEMTGCS